MLALINRSLKTYKTIINTTSFMFTKQNQGYKIIDEPRQSSRLIFDENGLCKLYDYKSGQISLRKMVRYISLLTFSNGLLFGLQISTPIFGKINMVAFGLVTGLGYFLLSFLQIYSKRIVHRLYLSNDFETIHVQFFNAFWKPSVHKFNITQFQQPVPGFAQFTRFQLTRIGKIWININKNEFKDIQDYSETLDHILLGRPLTNLNLIKLKKKS